MRKTIYNASFEESEKLVDDNYIIKMLEENVPKRVKKRVFGMIFISFLVIGFYYLTKSVGESGSDSVEFFSVRFKMLWITWGLVGVLSILLAYVKYLSKRLSFSTYYNVESLFLLAGVGLQVFSMTISLVIWQTNSSVLVVFYCVLLILFPIVFNRKINQKLYKTLYNEDEEYSNQFSKFILSFEKYSKKYGGILLFVVVIFKYIQNKMGFGIEEGGFLDTALMVLSPVVVIGAATFFVGYKEDIIQGYYLNKYYEEYRQKFGFSIEEWYGRHSKMYKNQVKEQQKN